MKDETRKDKENLVRQLLNELIEDDANLSRAKHELQLIEDHWKNDQTSLDSQKWITSNVLQCLEVFYMQEHSACSAEYTNYLLHRFIGYLPLTPLQGTEDEWMQTAKGKGYTEYRNKRYYPLSKTVFLDNSVEYHDNDASSYSTDNGKTWQTNSNTNFEEITFPYYPQYKRYYLDKNGNIIKIEMFN